jgi:alpha-mannosidase
MSISKKLLRNEKLNAITLERAQKFVSKDYWTDINLYGRIYKKDLVSPLIDGVEFYSPPFMGVNQTDFYSFAYVMEHAEWKPASIGQSFGPSWSTHWFKVNIVIPNDFAGEEVHFIWDNNCEGMIFDQNGMPIQGLYGGGGDDRRAEYILTKNAKGGEKYFFYIEMACNGMFGNPGPGMFLNPPDPNKNFSLSTAELRCLDVDVWDLFWDFDIIIGIAAELTEDSLRACQAVNTLEKMLNTCFLDDRSTYLPTALIAEKFLSQKNGDSQMQIYGSGHCHIDTAWLWTYSETRRKCARSWSTQLTYMDLYKDYVFTASQAQQHEWVKINYPSLFKKMVKYSQSDKFVPTGGTWVEMDCNVPSGESFVRQFLYGQNFFKENYGSIATEFWLPDTFGYSSQLPQIIKGAGMRCFLTQKLSWNLINKFPHNTFIWVGLDGTEVFSHFPPTDNYCSDSSVKEIYFTQTNFKNKGTSNNSMLLFGLGDGGGGPQLRMLERLKRVQDLDGLPKVKLTTPKNYFDDSLLEINQYTPKWVGELYFELHQGTYTTHAEVKYNNRKNEFLLRNVEILSSIALTKYKDFLYPKEQLDRIWKLLLLNQFHDVIPGTSIGPAYVDTKEHHEDIRNTGNNLISDAKKFLTKNDKNSVFFNPLAWSRREIIAIDDDIHTQKSYDGKSLVIVECDGIGFFKKTFLDVVPVSITEVDNEVVFENQHLKATFLNNGNLKSLFHKKTNKEGIEYGKSGNRFILFEDIPFYWDAWDVMIYHKDKGRYIDEVTSELKIRENGPLRVSADIEYKISDVSTIKQTIILDAVSEQVVFETKVDWHENRKFLKVEFPLNVLSQVATYSTHFGVIQRPTHSNTSWDMAKYEVCGHHWGDLSEYGFGVSLLNDCKYGYSCWDNRLLLSLLRSPKKPDDGADMGEHTFKYAIHPHQGDYQIANLPKVGYNFNVPMLIFPNSTVDESLLNKKLFSVDNENIILDTIKKEELNGSNGIIIRLWESMGGRGTCRLSSEIYKITDVQRTNLLEEVGMELPQKFSEEGPNVEEPTFDEETLTFKYRSFEIITLRLTLELR